MIKGKGLRFHFEVLLVFLTVAIPIEGTAVTVAPYTVSFANLVTGTTNFQSVDSTFSFPKFDASLGTLQSVNLALNFSGIVVGSANGPAANHALFFDLLDTVGNFSIGEPNLTLTGGHSSGGALLFGPQFQSASVVFSVGSGDLRYETWGNGPGNVSARLGVYFDNYTYDPLFGLRFYDGTDTGVYNGSFSVSYSYTPIPEPGVIAFATVAILLVVCARRKH